MVEAAMSKRRLVKIDRIKRLRVRGKVAYVKGFKPTDDEMQERAASAIAKDSPDSCFGSKRSASGKKAIRFTFKRP